ncbi:MAG: heavy-metal-associated domain-containing protein [Flavobacteriales bacterium]|nr:heavy-metal-associated domain-containing protein [Flavobacteriales bacterium]NQX99613.1 heavy-metal-associated domain-containing protein [Flavobacteriaceae bacterium]
MRKTLIIISFVLIGSITQAQQKNLRVSIEVDGVCMMCKKRIEKAALNTQGVKFASWDVKTHQLSLIIDERKTSVKVIKKNIAAVGHDTKEIKATQDAYNSVNPCCKYRDKKTVENHGKGHGH